MPAYNSYNIKNTPLNKTTVPTETKLFDDSIQKKKLDQT